MLIAALGVPKYSHPDDVDRAVATALGLSKTLEQYGMGFSIGISSGLGYCGCVGNNSRQEYAIIGSTVNLAAKIMAKMMKKNSVHCDDITRDRTDPTKFIFDAKGSIIVKGFSNPVSIYKPNKKLWSMVKNKFHRNTGGGNMEVPSRRDICKESTLFVNRAMGADGQGEEIVNVFLRRPLQTKVVPLLNATEIEPSNDMPNMTLLVHGKRGLGRTQFVKHATGPARRRGFAVFYSFCTSKSRPYAGSIPLLCSIFDLNPLLNSEEHANAAWDIIEDLISEIPGQISLDLRSTLRLLLLQQSDDGQLIQSPKSKARIEYSTLSNVSVDEIRDVLIGMVSVALKKKKTKGSVIFLVVEELHLMDEASISLLNLMINKTYETRLVFIFTSIERRVPLLKIDNALELHPMTREDTAYLLAIQYSEPVEDYTVDIVHASAGGSPYWIVELGKLTKRVGRDESHAMNAAGQFGLQKCILERYDKLSELQQDVLKMGSIVSCAGSGTFSLSLILKLAPSPNIVAAIIEKNIMFSSGMEDFIHVEHITEDDGDLNDSRDALSSTDAFRFNHPVVLKTVYDIVPRAERLLAHEKVAQAIILESLGGYESLHTKLEIITRHFELALCHDKFIM